MLATATEDRALDIKSRQRKWILLSPIIVTLLGQAGARLLGPAMGVWSWAPLMIGYWAACALLIHWGSGGKGFSRWLRPSRGSDWWRLLAIAFAVLPTLPMLLTEDWRLYQKVQIWLPTLIFIALNPFMEEGYWRGLLLDAAGPKYRWAAVLYSSALFMLNHMWIGVMAIGARNPAASIFQLVFGAVMSITYLKTSSLRWSIAAHFLTNLLLTPTVAVFLNLYIPGS